MPTQTKVIKALRACRRIYADKCKEAGKGHSLGPPEGHLYVTLISTLCPEDVGAKTRNILTEHGKSVDQVSVATVLNKVKHLKISKCYGRNQAKIT
eukprot:6440343-Pyramimonas_sp.AAC.1